MTTSLFPSLLRPPIARWLLLLAAPAGLSVGVADTTYTTNATLDTNTAVSGLLAVGNNATLTINNGAGITSEYGAAGYTNNGSAMVSGAGSAWTNTKDFYVGYYNATGFLTIRDGASVSNNQGYIGYTASGTGTVSVTGSGSTWINQNIFNVGFNGKGTLNISDGGSVSNSYGYLGFFAGSIGTAFVSGPGSSWISDGDLTVAREGAGSLSITDGGSVSTTNYGSIASFAGGTGDVSISGAGSVWTTANGLNIGIGGAGTLTVSNGGKINATDSNGDSHNIYLASYSDSSGTLNIGAAAGAPAAAAGIVSAFAIQGGSGTSIVQFNTTGTALAPTYLTRDGTRGGTAVIITSSTAVVHTAGVTVLSGASTYTGGTTIKGGTLLANNASGSALGTGAVVVESGATLGGFGRIGALTTIKSGAHLAPGEGVGTLTFTRGLSLNSGAVLDFELGTSRDSIRVSGGTLSGAGKVTVNLFDSGGFTAGTYTLIDATGATLSGIGASTFELGTTISGYTYTFSQSNNQFRLIASAIPEPAAFASLAGLGALAFALRRRHSK